jgi:hypothetical protein
MKKDKLHEFLIESVKKLQKNKGKFNATIDKDIDEVIHNLRKSIKVNEGLKIK